MNDAPHGRVLIMAGGTGGHIFPGLAVADCLRRDGVDVRWLGAAGAMECQRVPAAGLPLDVVDIAALRGKGLGRWLVTPFRLLRAVAQAVGVLGRLRPDCAISFGGYAAGPGGLAARVRGVPLLVHEQNRVPGLTNRTLARVASRVLQAFPGTWPEALDAETCGNPVRRDVTDLPAPAERMAGRSGPVRILVTGGSQGARALNRIVPAAAGLLAADHDLEIRHQAGKGGVDATLQAYRDAGIPVGAASAAISPTVGGSVAAEAAPTGSARATVTEFIDDMAAAYGWADLVVCRAGALTVSEVAAAGLPAVFVPFPHAVDDHQSRNAAYLADAGAALLLPEDGLDANGMAEALASLARDPSRRLQMAEQARARAVPDAAERVARLCREYLPT